LQRGLRPHYRASLGTPQHKAKYRTKRIIRTK
jgi:hypothetical protein